MEALPYSPAVSGEQEKEERRQNIEVMGQAVANILGSQPRKRRRSRSHGFRMASSQ